MRLPVYVAVTSLAISLLVVGGVFAVRPKKAAPPKLSLPHPLILEDASHSHLSKSIVDLHRTLLADAATGNIAEAQKCLDAGAEVNVFEDRSKWFTPLTYAAQSGDIKMTRLLLKHGADPNAGGARLSPLFWTISDNESDEVVECIRLLLKAGADPSGSADGGDRPIDLAIYEGNVATTQLLIEWMPKLDAYDRRKYLQDARNIALCKTVREGTLSQVRKLVADGADVNHIDMSNDAPLMSAVSRGSIPIVKYLLVQGANVDSKNDQGRTALMFTGYSDEYFEHSIRETSGDIATLLLQHGAKIGQRDIFRKTALMYAAQGGSKAVEVLLAHGAKVNEQDEGGYTALHYAAEVRDDQSLGLLLKHGAHVDVHNQTGVTALMLASVNPDGPSTQGKRIQRLKCLSFLKQFGANEDLKDKAGETAKSYANRQDMDFVNAS